MSRNQSANSDLPFGDGSSRIFGMENFGNTCYCNSILQCLFFTNKFRTELVGYNSSKHDRRLTLTGSSYHPFTAKYEQLVAKRLKEQGKPPLTSADSSSNGTTVPSTSSRPSMRNSIFGKFSTSSAPVLNVEDVQTSQYKKLGYIFDAVSCDALSTEQRLIVKKNPDFHNLQILVTRPTAASAASADGNRNDNSQASTALLEAGNGNSNANSVSLAAPTTSRSSFVLVGIPYPEANLVNPINPFNANPTADQRKRSALINGPIINVDHAFQESDVSPETCLLYALKDLFEAMVENKSQIGVVSPSYFVSKLKERNFLFRQVNMHQDAHEFCNYLVNETIESLNLEVGADKNWCTQIFQGLITNETKCLSCETITSKDETFLDLSIDIPPGESAYSLTYSLNNFSKLETLNHQNKFYCNTCLSLQEAVKTIKLKRTPEVLVINFKRFKYDEKLDRMVKLFDSILYPLKLRLFNTTTDKKDDNPGDFTLYGLYALVVHIGGGPMHGHYVALCKCQAGLWFLFDDETIEIVDEAYVLRFFGNGPGLASAYILFYEKLETKGDDGVDFGIDLNGVYNGSDYSIAMQQMSTSGFGIPHISEEPSTASIVDPEAVKEFAPEQASLDNSIGRKTSIFKKTFMFDKESTGDAVTRVISRKSSNKETGPYDPVPPPLATTKPAPGKFEKKSWVNGLKRRELKADMLTPERKSSLGSIIPTASEKTTDTKECGEKEKRRSSIFSFKRKGKQ